VLDETTLRFPSALYATLGVIFLYFLGAKLFGTEVGLLGGAILATTMIYQTQAVNARVDMTLCFFVTLSLITFLQHLPWFLDPPAMAVCDVSVGRLGDAFQGAARIGFCRDW
jgi:asparagine N-glycosylation enzyme membrane subunit Stt3